MSEETVSVVNPVLLIDFCDEERLPLHEVAGELPAVPMVLQRVPWKRSSTLPL